MKSNIKVLIFAGAGATIPWGGVKTSAITNDLIGTDDFFMLIKEKLSISLKEDVNFEDIINAIENLFLYYRGKQKPVDSEIPFIFNVNSVIENYIKKQGYKEEDTPSFLAEKFYKAIQHIIILIRDYSIGVKDKKEENNLLGVFLKYLNEKSILRTYTTNYDRLFIDACKNSDLGNSIEFFDGFPDLTEYTPTDNDNIITGEFLKRFSLKQVLNNSDKNCFYNLHGSIYWDWKHFQPFEPNEYSQFFCSENTIDLELHGNDLKVNSVQSGNPKEPFLLSPIITGYKKTQRLSLPPFNAFYNSFLEDCYECDTWYIIGYSFSDIHLNNLMKTAIIQKKVMPKIIWVRRDKEAINQDSVFVLGPNFQDLFDSKKYSKRDDYINVTDYLFKSTDEKIFLYFNGFEEFLQKEIWRDIL